MALWKDLKLTSGGSVKTLSNYKVWMLSFDFSLMSSVQHY